MRIFVTGGTGFIGEATIRDLVGAGHDVLALARSDKSAASLEAMGAVAYRGELGDACLTAGADQCDGVIHLAFDHTDLHGWAEKDRAVITTLANALEGSGKALVTTSVIAVVKPGLVATEADLPSSDGIGAFRAGSEEITRQAAKHGVRASIVRLPPTVHGDGDRMFVPNLISAARRTGVSGYVLDGCNHWSAVHRLDAARLFRLAVERAAPGECFHAVAEGAIEFRAIAEVIGNKLQLPTRSIGRENAAEHFGWLSRFVDMDCLASSVITRARLNWDPREPDLLRELREGSYFDGIAAGR
jgi:nucleoside-diphosphate-sugar epimerase